LHFNLSNGQHRGGVGAAIEGGQEADEIVSRLNATLVKNPRSLHIIWQEYEFGVGGRKPAKNFTATERGTVKYAICRKIVWETISGLYRAGHTPQVAIDMIYDVYGASTAVTTILKMIRRDKAAGHVHPNLRV
jgi:hypothetical protein